MLSDNGRKIKWFGSANRISITMMICGQNINNEDLYCGFTLLQIGNAFGLHHFERGAMVALFYQTIDFCSMHLTKRRADELISNIFLNDLSKPLNIIMLSFMHHAV